MAVLLLLGSRLFPAFVPTGTIVIALDVISRINTVSFVGVARYDVADIEAHANIEVTAYGIS